MAGLPRLPQIFALIKALKGGTNTPWLLAEEVEADGRSTKFCTMRIRALMMLSTWVHRIITNKL